MKECVLIDGVRTANGRAHLEKGWFRNQRSDELLTDCYDALFARNPKVKPEDADGVFVGAASLAGRQMDIARIAWLAGGYPDSVPSNSVCQQCPSGMACLEHAARAIMVGEGDIFIVGGVDDMTRRPEEEARGASMAPRLAERYNPFELPMGPTAEKVAEQWKVPVEDMEQMTYYSHKRAAAAHKEGKFKDEIVPVDGLKEDGTPFKVEMDQWVREDISIEGMRALKPAFKPDGVITAAFSSPLSVGAAAAIVMSRDKADELGLDYHIKYVGGTMAGCDPTIMGIGPIYAVRKLLARLNMTIDDIDVVELNEAFASQALACLRDLGIEDGFPFKKTNLWGGALALGHPLGESGLRIVITMNNIMKKDMPDAKYGLAALCGGFGNANASVWAKVDK